MTRGDEQHHHLVGSQRAWGIWALAVSVYFFAVFNRSSLGVAGLLATDRFGIQATELALFTVLQLVVYAGLQVPVGILIDRFGPTRLLIGGLVLMSAGQLVFALSHSFPIAVVARAVVGAGDATAYNSVLRLVAVWFFVRQAPGLAQLTGNIGNLGGLLASVPLSWALHHAGWTPTFAAVALAGLVLLVFIAWLVRDSPYPKDRSSRPKLRALARSVGVVWSNPGTRLGLWAHFTAAFASNLFALLWGFPFLVKGEGLSPGTASALIGLMVVASMAGAWVLVRTTTRHPYFRSYFVLVDVAAIVAVWTVVLVLPGQAPMWLLVVLVAVTATGGPASLVGIDLARTFNPLPSIGRANGVVNMGGFVATLLAMALIGVVLDWREPRGSAHYDLDDFRVAFCVLYLFWLLGAVQIVRYRRRALRHLDEVHPGAVETLKAGSVFLPPY